MTCKLCGIEHSSSWTCLQAKANLEDWNVPRETSVAQTPQTEPIVAEKSKLGRGQHMKEWWRKKREQG